MAEPIIEHMECRLSKRCRCVVVFVGAEITQESIQKLIELLSVMEDCFPTEEELVATEQPKDQP